MQPTGVVGGRKPPAASRRHYAAKPAVGGDAVAGYILRGLGVVHSSARDWRVGECSDVYAAKLIRLNKVR
jgi:hypothetical protein